MAGVITLSGGAAATGFLGEERAPEHFESKQIVVSPEGTNGLHVREVVDMDFGFARRHGYQRIIPHDFGEPIDVRASSPDAPDQVNVSNLGYETQIRIGDPDTTVSGQHRYVLDYTYPDTTLGRNQLALDIIGNDETLETTRFEVVVTGLELRNPTCNVGSLGSAGGCELTRQDDGTYRALVAPLEPRQGITIGGRVTGRTDVVDVAEPPTPDRAANHRLPLAAGYMAAGSLAAAAVYFLFRRMGSNEIAGGGGAADAAYGNRPDPRIIPPDGMPLPPGIPAPPDTANTLTGPTRRITDAELARLATTEFAPPRGMQPWEGNVLLAEKITTDASAAWVSGLAARDIVDLSSVGGTTTLSIGPKFDQATDSERQILSQMFSGRSSVILGRYSKGFAAAWRSIPGVMRSEINSRNYWRHPIGSALGGSGVNVVGLVPMIIFFFLWFGGFSFLRVLGAGSSGRPALLTNPISAGLLSLLAAAIVAAIVYRTMLASRTAAGSAAVLQVESFRRFLAASEGRHVEWAWKQGLLREYSAWAVALGAASAWESAMKQSGIPPYEYSHGPIVMYTNYGSFRSTTTPPSSSGGGGGFGGGGGGFSGGSVGGGGGGGSSGSW